MDNNVTKQNRIIYLDYLRVFATFAVMIIHISAQHFYDTDIRGLAWQSFNIYDSLFRWGVPVFAMISGSLFLSRDIPVKKIYSKYVLRMAIAFIAWCFIYYVLCGNSIYEQLLGLVSYGKTYRYIEILNCPYHLWFVLTISGIYICLPIIRKIVEDIKVARYFLIVSFVFISVLPLLSIIIVDLGDDRLRALRDVLESDIRSMNLHLITGYVCYFILGYYLNITEIPKKKRLVIYLLGIFGAAFTMLMNVLVAFRTNTFCDNYYGYFFVNVLVESVAVFVLSKYISREHWLDKFIQKLSKYSFGAYLVHLLIIYKLDSIFGLNTLSFNPALSVPVIACIVFVVSFLISFVLNQIPVIRKYLV